MIERECTICHQVKPVERFHKMGMYALKDGTKRQTYRQQCKDCMNVHWQQRIKSIFAKAGVQWKCACCGYDKFVGALELHHTDGEQKDNNVSSMWTYSEERILKEIEKCVVLCATCHREVHGGVRQIAI